MLSERKDDSKTQALEMKIEETESTVRTLLEKLNILEVEISKKASSSEIQEKVQHLSEKQEEFDS